ARQGLAWIIDECLKKIYLAPRQLDDFVVFRELPGGWVEDKGTKRHGFVLVQRRRAFLAAQHRFDARQELARIEGLAEVIVGARFQANDAINGFIARGQ